MRIQPLGAPAMPVARTAPRPPASAPLDSVQLTATDDRQRLASSLDRMATASIPADLRMLLADELQPFGAGLVERLERNGLKIALVEQGYPHYDTRSRTLTWTLADLREDRPEVPFRTYMILHEFAHAMDFLLDPAKGPLSEREDLGIAAHRTRLGDSYRQLKTRFDEIESRLKREGRWTPPPRFPTSRVYYEDLMTVVEATTGERLAERPARGHLDILAPDKRPTEYFSDAVYCYLHSEPSREYRYALPDGRPFRHPYPPDRRDVAARDPRMHAALERFFAGPGRPEDLAVR